MTDDRAARIDAAVRAVPGVVQLFAAPVPPALAALPRIAAGAPAPLSRVADDVDGVRIQVTIGVRSHPRPVETARAVVAAVRDALGDPGARVQVRIARVVPGDEPSA